MRMCSQQDESVSSLLRMHVQCRQQLGSLTVLLHYNVCTYKDMRGKWECILVKFHANVILSADTWLHNLNKFTFSFHKDRIAQHLSLGQNSLIWPLYGWKQPIVCLVVEVHVSLCYFSHLICISFCCYDAAQLQWRTSVWCWNDTTEPRHFCWHTAFGLSPQHTAVYSQSALQWNLFMPIEKKWFFFFLTASQRRAGTMEAFGCCSLRLRHTAEMDSIIMRAYQLWSSRLRMVQIVCITGPAASW